jgi:hypothetical protein
MKKLNALLLIVFLFAGCNTNDPLPEFSTPTFDQILELPKESLNALETTSLIFMREEEKLARDVYQTLYTKWGINIFKNIAESEQTHTDAIKTLISKYQLTDPVQNDVLGVFENDNLQQLYNQLVAKGSTSLLDAYTVGATIEDLDIYDLEEALSGIDNQDITLVYNNLTKGSRNHMRSFYGKITGEGELYKAQFISQEKLESIINSSKETGSW